MKRLCHVLILLALSQMLQAQTVFGGIVEVDKTVHNFGDVLMSDGPVSCSFTLKNVSGKAIAIQSVVSSCGCTDVNWTKSPIAAGKTGKVTATYSNDEGPYPFDKDLTVYVSGLSKPVILKLRGVSYKKQGPLDKEYPVHFGTVGLRSADMKVGNMEQGGSVSEEITVANFGKSPVKLEFKDLSAGLSISVTPSVIPAGKTATLKVKLTADLSKWGKNYYYATPVVAGKAYAAGSLAFWGMTRENFDGWTKEQKDNASKPMFDTSTYTFGKVKAGKQVEASFTVANKGKSKLEVFSVDSDFAGAKYGKFPVVAPGAKSTFKVSLDTTNMPKGEALVILTLMTNCPSRPIINLFITGWID